MKSAVRHDEELEGKANRKRHIRHGMLLLLCNDDDSRKQCATVFRD